jgi:hypothetical protein
MPSQTDWRFCHKCDAMFFNGFPGKGQCPAGSGHDAAGFNFNLPHELKETPNAQANWRFCRKCSAMFFDGFPGKGHCQAGGGHEASGFNFDLPHDLPQTPTAQSSWRFCQKCAVMFFNGFPDKGRCPAGGAHDASGFNFVLPHDLPSTLNFDFSPIVLNGGVPVGGFSHLTVREDGSFTFSGHLHDSGATEFNVSVAVALKDSQNQVYTFQHSGHVSGTFESGSRNDDWTVDSRNDQIADNWAYLAAGSTAQARTEANVELVNVTNSLIGTLGTVLGVVAIVIA